MDKTVIVIGLSAASMAFITKLRSFDQTSKIICFSAESHVAYNRCLLADVLTGDNTVQAIQLKPDDFFEKNNIEIHVNTRVTSINTKDQMIFVGDQPYAYDTLFLGIGTRPLVPSNLVTDGVSGVFTFHTLADMQNIQEFIDKKNPQSAIVIGAGLNGMEAASCLVQKNIAVTIVEAQSTVLPGQVDMQVAEWVSKMVQNHGVTVLTGRKVMEICRNGQQVTGVKLDSGSELAADMVVIAAGSRLNSDLLLGTGIHLHQGSVVVSLHLQTSDPHVLAAGDICVVPDFITKDLVRSTTWSDAMLQGLCAATTLSPTPRAYQGSIGLRDSYFFGKNFYGCGDTISGRYTKTVRVLTDLAVEVIYTYGGTLRGFVLIGDVSKVPELKKQYVTQEVCF